MNDAAINAAQNMINLYRGTDKDGHFRKFSGCTDSQVTSDMLMKHMGDILCDLQLWAHKHNVDWQDALEYANRHFRTESEQG